MRVKGTSPQLVVIGDGTFKTPGTAPTLPNGLTSSCFSLRAIEKWQLESSVGSLHIWNSPVAVKTNGEQKILQRSRPPAVSNASRKL